MLSVSATNIFCHVSVPLLLGRVGYLCKGLASTSFFSCLFWWRHKYPREGYLETLCGADMNCSLECSVGPSDVEVRLTYDASACDKPCWWNGHTSINVSQVNQSRLPCQKEHITHKMSTQCQKEHMTNTPNPNTRNNVFSSPLRSKAKTPRSKPHSPHTPQACPAIGKIRTMKPLPKWINIICQPAIYIVDWKGIYYGLKSAHK